MTVDSTIPTFKIDTQNISVDEILASTNIWNTARKKLILVGVNEPNAIESEIINAWTKDESIVVMTETTSNLHHPTFLNSIDTVITPFLPNDFKDFQPDLLITFGGMVVSKRVKAFLRKYKPCLLYTSRCV